jgi:CheY-like chemotaxis protein
MDTPNSLSILVAEDNEDDLFLLKEAFKKAGVAKPFQVVSDGLEVVAYLQGEGIYADRKLHPFPDLLLLDLNMPCRNGFEVLEWIRSSPHCSRLMVHVITASIRQADVNRVYELRANSYIVKPTRLDELAAFVAALHSWHRYAVLPRIADPAEKPADAAAGQPVSSNGV